MSREPVDRGTAEPEQRWEAALAMLLTVAARLLFIVLTGFLLDDAYISLRYAENLAAGNGLVYNPGEWVFGASTPLYVLLLAGLKVLGLPPLETARLLGVAADGLTLLLWWRLLRPCSRAAAWAFTLLFAFSSVMAPMGSSGMETPFALLTFSWALAQEWRPAGPLPEGGPSEVRLGIALGILSLLRPDGLLAAGWLLGHRAWRTRAIPWRAAGLWLGLLAPWLLVATLCYGSPLPNSIPAKVAAYNIHRGWMPNVSTTLAELAPLHEPWPRRLANGALLVLLAAGMWRARREARWRLPAATLLLWWLYLVVPRTLLFPWYLPFLLLPAYLLAAGGAQGLEDGESRRSVRAWALMAAMTGGLIGYFGLTCSFMAGLQRADAGGRRAIGLWLRDNTPAEAVVAMEPIGYIGYHSRRRVLDEVGLVSPGMIPLNRAGEGWFGRMVDQFAPDYVVERPAFLVRNVTLNSGVRMFRDEAARQAFVERYAPVQRFRSRGLPRSVAAHFQFVVFRRRSPDEAAQVRDELMTLEPPVRAARVVRLLEGEDAPLYPGTALR